MTDSSVKDGGPAFPFTCQGPTTGPEFYYGMSLRDYFAAAALQGMLAYSYVNPNYGNYHETYTSQQAAGAAYDHADAMLKERAK